VTNAPSAPPRARNHGGQAPRVSQRFLKSNRLLRPKDFREVYDRGSRFSCSHFVAFLLRRPDRLSNPGLIAASVPLQGMDAAMERPAGTPWGEPQALDESVATRQWPPAGASPVAASSDAGTPGPLFVPREESRPVGASRGECAVPTGQGSATSGTGPRIGFTIPRAVGKAVVRNRIRRRLREILRKRLDEIDPGMDLVINPRRKAYEAPLEDLRRDVERLVTRCRAL
jgi:ribonuclease P protein component